MCTTLHQAKLLQQSSGESHRAFQTVDKSQIALGSHTHAGFEPPFRHPAFRHFLEFEDKCEKFIEEKSFNSLEYVTLQGTYLEESIKIMVKFMFLEKVTTMKVLVISGDASSSHSIQSLMSHISKIWNLVMNSPSSFTNPQPRRC